MRRVDAERESGHTLGRQKVRACGEDRVRIRSVAYMLFLLIAVGGLATAQKSQVPNPVPNPVPRDPAYENSGPRGNENHDQMMADMAKKANQERQAALRSDTDRLVKLTAELKEYVDKSNENILSLDVLRKAEEIEKLARSVKDKMKGPN